MAPEPSPPVAGGPGTDVAGAGTRRRGRPPAQRSAQTEADILRAARVRFSRTGYARTSVAQIAGEAGVTSRAVYHYVESKPELFGRTLAAAHHRVRDEVVTRVEGRRDARDALHGWIDAFRALFDEDPSLVQFLSVAVTEAERNRELVGTQTAGPAGITGLNRWLVERAVRHGELAPGVDPAGVVALLEVFGAGLAVLARDDGGQEWRAMFDALCRLIDGTLLTAR